MTFTAVFIENPRGGYTVFVEEFPGVTSQGRTLEEARENLRHELEDVFTTMMEVAKQRGTEGQHIVKEPFEYMSHPIPATNISEDILLTIAVPTLASGLLECAGTWKGDDLDDCLEDVYATRQQIIWDI